MSVIIPNRFRMRYKKLFDNYGEYKEFIRSLMIPLQPQIRITTLKYNPIETYRLIKKHIIKGIPWYEWGFFVDYEEIGNTLEHHLGMVYSQDGSSMIPPLVLNPSEEDVILDMCAAPGSKTTFLAVNVLVGLFGLHINIALISLKLLITSLIKSRFNLKLSSEFNFILITLAPYIFEENSYSSNVGFGIITLSPSLINASAINLINRVVPLPKTIQSLSTLNVFEIDSSNSLYELSG